MTPIGSAAVFEPDEIYHVPLHRRCGKEGSRGDTVAAYSENARRPFLYNRFILVITGLPAAKASMTKEDYTPVVSAGARRRRRVIAGYWIRG